MYRISGAATSKSICFTSSRKGGVLTSPQSSMTIFRHSDKCAFSFFVVCPERPCSLIILRAVQLLSSLRQQQNADRKAITFK
jgi:hypothetical protein